MNRILQTLKSKRGLAILLVLCVFAMLMAFGVSVLLASSAAVGGAAANFEEEQVKLSTQSVCELMRAELTGTHASPLRNTANAMLVGDLRDITATLPEGMGEVVESSIVRNKANRLYAVVTVELGESRHTLQMTFSRTETPVPPPGTGVTVAWQFTGYHP